MNNLMSLALACHPSRRHCVYVEAIDLMAGNIVRPTPPAIALISWIRTQGTCPSWVPQFEQALISAGRRGEGLRGLEEATRFIRAKSFCRSQVLLGLYPPLSLLALLLVLLAYLSPF